MIKVIAFDYAGVVTPGPMTQWAENNQVKDQSKWDAYLENAHKWDRGEMTVDQVYEILFGITGIPAGQIWEEFYAKAVLRENVVEIIKRLKKNYKIFLFSNFISEPLRKLIKHHQIDKYFDGVIISSEHKMQKPHFEFFDLLVKRAGVKKDEIIFIDDSIKNVEGAKEYGIKSILFTNAKNLSENLRTVGLSF